VIANNVMLKEAKSQRDGHKHEDSSLKLDSTNAQAYDRRQHERRGALTDVDAENKPRRKVLEREVWWVIAAYVMMGAAFVAILLVK
jgi:hypothetical protein